MAEFDYDLFVIGAGSGGVRAARLAAELGARVGVAEEYRIGGTCVIRGCVPKKLLVYGARYAGEFEDARGFGWTCEDLRFDWPTLIRNVRREVDRLNGAYTRTLEKANVDLFLARASLESPHSRAARRARRHALGQDYSRCHRRLSLHPQRTRQGASHHLQRVLRARGASRQHRHCGGGLYRHGVRLDLRRARRCGDGAAIAASKSCATSTWICATGWPMRCAIAESISA